MHDLTSDLESCIRTLLGKPFSEYISPQDLDAMKRSRQYITQFFKTYFSASQEVSIRISLVNSNMEPMQMLSIGQMKEVDLFLSGEPFKSSELYHKLERMVILAVVENGAVEDYMIASYMIPAQDGRFMSKMEESYEHIQESVADKLMEDQYVFVSVSHEQLHLKPKDSKPYTPIYSEIHKRVVSEKAIGWYLGKSPMQDIYMHNEGTGIVEAKPTERYTSISEKPKGDFYDLIRRLKMSSRDSVADINSSDELARYLHIHRPIEDEFFNLVETCRAEDGKRLILLVGNSGDGKSKLLQRLQANHPEITEEFMFHNDATESFYIHKDSVETLAEVLKPFSDGELNHGDEKAIVAINMGIVGKFLDSDVAENYSALREYIVNTGILESGLVRAESSSEIFKSISFADSRIFEINKDGIWSDFIDAAFEKIFGDNEGNPFRNAFGLIDESIRHDCPVAVNYMILTDQDIRSEIIRLILLAHLEKNILLTPRIIWNFIYDILMGSECDINYSSNSNKVSDAGFFLNNLFFNRIFNTESEDGLIRAVSAYTSYLENRKEYEKMMHDLIIRMGDGEGLQDYLTDDLNIPQGAFFRSILEQFERDTRVVLRTLVRFRGFSDGVIGLCGDIAMLNDFGSILYDCNHLGITKGPIKTVRETVRKWNGEHLNSDRIFVELVDKEHRKAVTFNKNKLKVECPESNGDIRRIPAYIKAVYNSDGCELKLEIGYALYKMMKMLEQGYVLNAEERLDFVKVEEFVDKITQHLASGTDLYIHHGIQTHKLTYENGCFEFSRRDE